MSAEYEPRHLLTPPFYVSISLVSKRLLLKEYRYVEMFKVPEPLKIPRSKILDLYFFTTTYATWASYIFRILTLKDPWDNLESVVDFVVKHHGSPMTVEILHATLGSYPERTRYLLNVWIRTPQMTVDDLKHNDDCWECCYEDPSCRATYNDNEIECFEKCIAESLK